MLTHVREKLHFVRERVEAERAELETNGRDLGSQKADLREIKRVCLKQEKRRDAIDRGCLRVTEAMLLDDMARMEKEKCSLRGQLEDLKTVCKSSR